MEWALYLYWLLDWHENIKLFAAQVSFYFPPNNDCFEFARLLFSVSHHVAVVVPVEAASMLWSQEAAEPGLISVVSSYLHGLQ